MKNINKRLIYFPSVVSFLQERFLFFTWIITRVREPIQLHLLCCSLSLSLSAMFTVFCCTALDFPLLQHSLLTSPLCITQTYNYYIHICHTRKSRVTFLLYFSMHIINILLYRVSSSCNIRKQSVKFLYTCIHLSDHIS